MSEKIIDLFYLLFVLTVGTILGIFISDSNIVREVKDYIKAGHHEITQEMNKSIEIDGKKAIIWVDDKEKVHDGLILITHPYTQQSSASLFDSDGNEVFSWFLPKEITYPKTREYHKIDFNIEKSLATLADAHLFPNGNLLTSQSIENFYNMKGQRLVMLNKDSEIIWQINDSFHHEIYLDEEQNIYALTSDIVDKVPAIVSSSDSAFMDEIINVISNDGKVLKRYSIADAFKDSGFENFVSLADDTLPKHSFIGADGRKIYDPFHINTVQYISKELAATNSLFKEGDFLVSIRSFSSIAIFRPELNKIVWASRGPWIHQHHVFLKEDGRIYLYDNKGGSEIIDQENQESKKIPASRILAFDPITNKSETIYDGMDVINRFSDWRGHYQKINNDSYIMNSPNQGRIFQFDSMSGNIIWEMRLINDRDIEYPGRKNTIHGTRFYSKDELDFIN